MLFLGAQLVVAVDPIAFDLEKLLSDTLPFHRSKTWNFVEDFSQAHCRSLAGGGLLSTAINSGCENLDSKGIWLHSCATMKTATVRDLRNRYTSLLRWISAGEEILITQRGVVIARLSPETARTAHAVNWADAPEVRRDRSHERVLGAAQSAALIAEAGGKW